ncbi:hypothetical protein DPX16_5020 [Anabarilius grahami]|uniref:Uncharacterized protein n=1 Tax=Anabarilius grahami TaxID=495550 RepID=A0A3N0Z9G6_ANAGA|nr:hypothetical protein DPX16_5020 [Anabarilius grahami]
MDPAAALLCLEQRDRSLESHTLDFLELACQTHFPNRSLCVFYHSSLSERSRAHLPGSGPWKDFAAFMEWVLVSNNSPFIIGPAEENFTTSPTPLPETNQPPPVSDATEMLLEPIADCGDRLPVRDEPVPRIRTEPFIALEPGPLTGSDQVREPATPVVAEGVIVELEGWEESPAHTTTAENPPSPASSSNQFLGPTIAAVLQPFIFCMPDAYGLLSTSAIPHRGSPVSTSSLCAPCSTSDSRHSGSTVAPPSLGSTGHHRPYGFSGLPRLSGSVLVSRPTACTYGAVWLLLPSSSAYILGPTGSTSVLWTLFLCFSI